MGAGGDQIAPQPVAPLAQGDVVAPQGGTSGGLHPGHAAPHHQHGFLPGGGGEGKGSLPGGLGIHRAPGPAAHFQGANAPLVAADTGADVLRPPRGHLLGVGRVGQGGPAQHHRVQLPLGNGLGGQIGVVHAAAAENGDFHHLLHRRRQGNHPPFLHIAGGRRIIKGIILPKVHTQAVIAVGLQPAGNLQPLLQGPPHFLFPVKGGLVIALDVGLQRQAHGDHKIRAAGGLDPLHNLPGTAEAVLQRPAVFVRPVVHKGQGKLVQQIPPVHGVDLNPREPALAEENRRGNHLIDLLLDLLPGQGRSPPGGIVVIGNLRGTEASQGVAAISHGNLGQHLGAIGVQPLQQLHRRPLKGLGGLQRLLAVQGMDRVHQGVRVKGPGK